MKKLLLCLFFFIYWENTLGQVNEYAPGQILHELGKLKVMGSAMYIAAHPDDENTLLITWLANEKKVKTSYFAITRGDGGQNLIGTEQGEYAGLLRTHELLGARSVDGGEQYFSRANDFGYSKTTQEAFEFWNKDLILADLVYRIRKFRPDVLITRFPPDERAGHGHHSASSVLAELAFDAAGDINAFPDQLKEVKPWKPTRLFWNSYNRGFTNTAPDDGGFYLTYDIGSFNPLLGESYGEIGGKARSMHKSQGFGSSLSRGERVEYLRLTKGSQPEKDLFDDVNLTWSRVKGGQQVQMLIDDVIRSFNPANPSASVPSLIQILSLLETLPPDPLVDEKKGDLKNIIKAAAGIHLESNAAEFAYAPGERAKVTIRAINRGKANVSLNKIELPETSFSSEIQESLTGKLTEKELTIEIPQDFPITQPYWLQEPHAPGNYTIPDESQRNLPMSPPALSTKVNLVIEGKEIAYDFPVNYKYVEPSKGEIYRYLEIRPAVMITPETNSMLFAKEGSQNLMLVVKAGKSDVSGKVKPELPEGWSISPTEAPFQIAKKHAEQVLNFVVSPPKNASEGELHLKAVTAEGSFNRGINSIQYDHIPELTTYPVADVKLVKPNLLTRGSRVGYIMGAGDKIPEALAQMGYNVTLIDESNVNQPLNSFDAILIGIRAYNTQDWIHTYKTKLNEYVFKGGTVICQYQTSGRFGGTEIEIAPYKLSIGRDRVSEEDAEVTFIKPDHVLLNKPNKITSADFEGWVQERGLYFAQEWAPEFSPILSMHDTNEKPLEGSLLHARYGSGNYIFTGLSFFRELPAGVPGAFRLLANMIAIQ